MNRLTLPVACSRRQFLRRDEQTAPPPVGSTYRIQNWRTYVFAITKRSPRQF